MGDLVRLEGVWRSFRVGGRRVEALCGISLTIPRACRVGLVGPDGAGKTTLLRLLAGLLSPDRGRVQVLGLELPGAAAAVQERVGYMPQRFGLYDDLSVEENLSLYADLYGLDRATRCERLAEILDATGLAPFRARLARHLSGGMRQKLALGAALLASPPLMLLDEPSVGVDPLSRRELWDLALRLAGRDATLVWSTAYLDEAERCERVLLLHEGRLLADGPPAALAGEMRGRVCRLLPPDGRPRPLFLQLFRRPGITDVSVRGGALRLVLTGELPPAAALPAAAPAPPRLEDAVVARLAGTAPPIAVPLPTAAADPPSANGHAEEVIRVRDLVRRFGDFRAVDGLSFVVRRGEIFGLLGPNGAGKSTTFRILCGLLPPSEGEAIVLGYDLRRAAPRARARIGYMAQKFSLYADLPVQANLEFAATAYGLPGWRRRARIRALAEEFELTPVLRRRSGDLPPGLRQRLAMAAALVHEPEILFLDEPTSGVDPLARRAFWYRIARLAEAGTTVLVTTHFLDEAEYCDRVLIIERGQELALGEPAQIVATTRSRHPEVNDLEQAFIALLRERRMPEMAG